MPHSPDGIARRAAPPVPRIALVSDRVDWHARVLLKALAAAGARAIVVQLEDCRFETDHPHGLHIPEFGDRLPDAVFVRCLSGGSFEAVTMRLGILHALRESGVPVINDARAIEHCVDKSMTSFLLARAGIRSPATWVTEQPTVARRIIERESTNGPLVLKPLFGSQGRNLRLIASPDDLPDPGTVAGVYYLQRFVGVERDGGFRDFRLLVWQGNVIATMMRHAPHWITNVKRGGRPVVAVPDHAMHQLALRAAAAVGADLAGIDILYDADDQPTVLEVNSMPAWSGLQTVTNVNIASVIASGLINTLTQHVAQGAPG
jgi:tetrahydromethanopterin:alpha-L-glutamate ligase